MACLALGASPLRAAPRSLVYGGDAHFPPYEYIGADGRPRGFNVELIGLLAEDLGRSPEFRLTSWKEALAALETGKVDVVSMAWTQERGSTYDLLVQTWTMHQALLFRPGRAAYPQGFEDLAGEVVAVVEDGSTHRKLLALPEGRRPALKPAADQLVASRLLLSGEVTAAAGNGLTLRHLVHQLGATGMVEVDVGSTGYFLATAKGRGDELGDLRLAFERLHNGDRFNRLVENTMVLPGSSAGLGGWARVALLAASLLGLAAVGVAGLNRALRRQVRARTSDLERVAAEMKALRHDRERFFEISPTLLCVLDRDAIFQQVNPAAERILGRSPQSLVGTSLLDILHPDDRERVQRVGPRLGEGVTDLETRCLHRDGSYRWLLWNGVSDRAQGLVHGVALDVTDRHQSEAQITHLAYHDPLTGLPNRALLLDRLEMAIAHGQRHQVGVAILFIDLDHFKLINDSLGHAAGDQLLQETGRRLRQVLREEDTVARLGGDEFIALLPGPLEPAHVSAVAEKLRQAIGQPMSVEGHELTVSASIGIGLHPGDGDDPQTLLKNADTAMYRAKELGRDGHQFYTAAMGARVREQFDLETRLRHALAHGDLSLHYQPILDLRQGEIVGLEALLRWEDPDRGTVLPAEFIPLCELTGLIVPIGSWALRTAARVVAAGGGGLRLAVNLSARQFHHAGVVEEVKSVLRETGLPPERLELELTETVAMQDQAGTLEVMRGLKKLGVRLSIDDFGTGYSSLSYLRYFPIDTLKIDRAFVRDIAVDPSAAGIALAIIAMARQLRLRVVAEGVETPEQFAFLRRAGCDEAQGFLFAHPAPPPQIAQALEAARKVFARHEGASVP